MNCTVGVVANVNGPCGAMTSACPPLPVTVPVADPVIPPTVAVIVTPEAGPTPVTTPAFTVAQGLELCQFAELVTSLLPLLKLAVAKSFTVWLWGTENVDVPPPLAPVVTVIEFG